MRPPAESLGRSRPAALAAIASVLALAVMLVPSRAGSGTAEDWGRMLTPSAGSTRIIGGPANGCIAGAVALPPDGTGYQAIHLSRHRNFGHPQTVAFVERLGKSAAAAGLAPFYVGDMAQPRGGPMTSGHAAHENGVDVDIWFNLDPKPDLAPAAREEVELPSMVLPDKTDIDRARFGERQVRLLRLAASDAHVDRIFVHRPSSVRSARASAVPMPAIGVGCTRSGRGTGTKSISMCASAARRDHPTAHPSPPCLPVTAAMPRSTGGSSPTRQANRCRSRLCRRRAGP